MYQFVLMTCCITAAVFMGVMRREMGRSGGTRRSICLGIMVGIQTSILLSLYYVMQEYSKTTWSVPDTYAIGIIGGLSLLSIVVHTGPLHGETMTMGDHPSYTAMTCLSIMTLRFSMPCIITYGTIAYLNTNLSQLATFDSVIRLIVMLSVYVGAIPGLVYYSCKHGFGITHYTEVAELVYPALYHSAFLIGLFFLISF